MSATSEAQSWFEARYGGEGFGWHVDRMEPHGSYTSRYNFSGPYTTRDEAEKVAADMTRAYQRGPNQGYPHPIAYSFDAAYHCPVCTGRRFGVNVDGWIPEESTDYEGNPVGALAPWDEWQQFDGGTETLSCDTCGGVIDTYADEDADDDYTVRELARELAARFTRRTRDDGSEYTVLTDAAPDWMTDVVREAHGGMQSDDWRYDTVASAVEFIADNDDYGDRVDEWADGVTDVYNAALYNWLGRGGASAYVDEARDDYGEAPGNSFWLGVQRGQYVEALEVMHEVIRALESRC